MYIEHITVKDFKGFGDFAVNDLRPVTLLGGDNGCGKTSLLEAILLCLHRRKSSYPIYAVLREMQIDSTAFASLLRHGGGARKFSVTCRGAESEYAIDAEITRETEDEYAPPHFRGDGVSDHQHPIGAAQALQLRINYKENKSTCGSMIFKIRKEYPPVTFDTVNPFDDSAQFVHMRPHGGLSGVFNRDPKNFDMLDKKTDKPEVIKALQIVAPQAQDIFLGLENDNPAVKIEMKSGEAASPSALGSGAHKLLSLALTLHAGRNGIFLLDEITIGWHHSHLVDLWRTIFHICQERNHQIIATTHSDEAITAFSEAAERENCKENTCYIRLDRQDDNEHAHIKPAVYDYDTLSASREMNWEIRG